MAFYSLSLYSLYVAGRGFASHEVRQGIGQHIQFNNIKKSASPVYVLLSIDEDKVVVIVGKKV
jgi:hypothetical protein